MTRKATGSRVGDDLVEAFEELAAYLRGDAVVESYEASDNTLTASRIQAIRKGVAPSTREFERRFHIPARTMEAYEQGRRRPNAAMTTLLRVIEHEPDAVRRALDPESSDAP